MIPPILRTKRLVLRKMNVHDFRNLMEIFSDPEAMKYYPSTKNGKQTNEWITWTLENYRKFNTGLWIVEDKVSGDFLGQCGIVPQKVEGVIEMGRGYLFARRVWGHGYATEAALACKNYGLKQMKLRKIVSLIDVKNTPSIKVAERIGMKVEKTTIKWGKQVSVYTAYLNQ